MNCRMSGPIDDRAFRREDKMEISRAVGQVPSSFTQRPRRENVFPTGLYWIFQAEPRLSLSIAYHFHPSKHRKRGGFFRFELNGCNSYRTAMAEIAKRLRTKGGKKLDSEAEKPPDFHTNWMIDGSVSTPTKCLSLRFRLIKICLFNSCVAFTFPIFSQFDPCC